MFATYRICSRKLLPFSSRPFTIRHIRHHATVISTNDLIEEEILPSYCPRNYCPVSIGKVFNGKYKVLAKFGFGRESTTWLAQDISRWRFRRKRYVTIKFITRDAVNEHCTSSELTVSQHIARTDPKHQGLRYLRTVLESFETQGQFDLKPDNILLGLEDDEVIRELVHEEEENPSPSKVYDDRRIYPHRNFGDLRGPPGHPKIADFGLAVMSPEDHAFTHPIQPDLFQSPEVILQVGWSYSADIWNLGVMIWDLLEGRPLFQALDPESNTYTADGHLQEMVSLLGPPPKDLLLRGKLTSQFFCPEGKQLVRETSGCRGAGLESTITTLSGEDKRLFLDFVTRMLDWLPEERATAGELLADPWLSS